jgi:RNA polymerase sigma-70 factor (ECF subfamily)
MPDTPLSLLDRVRHNGQPVDWDRLIELYSPLLRSWLQRHPLQGADVDDLLQDILAVLVQKLPQFTHPGHAGAFRGWLRAILVYRLRWHWREKLRKPAHIGDDDAEQFLTRLEQADGDLARRWDAEHDRHVVARLLELIRPEFTATTWQAFQGYVLEEKPLAEVAAELGLTANAVYIARTRVFRRLREEAAGLIEE